MTDNWNRAHDAPTRKGIFVSEMSVSKNVSANARLCVHGTLVLPLHYRAILQGSYAAYRLAAVRILRYKAGQKPVICGGDSTAHCYDQ